MKTNEIFVHEGDTLYLLTSSEAVDFLLSADGVKYVTSLTRISAKGIFQTLLKAAAPEDLGFDIITDSELDEKDFLRGNTRYSAIVSVAEKQQDDFENFMYDHDVETVLLGNVTDGAVIVDDTELGFIDDFDVE